MPVHVEDITNSGMRAMWENHEGPSSVAPAPCSIASDDEPVIDDIE